MNFLRKYRLSLFLAASIAFLAAYLLNRMGLSSSGELAISFEKKLHQKEQIASNELKVLAATAESYSYPELLDLNYTHYHELYDKEAISLLIYENDSLKLWTDNKAGVETYIKKICFDKPIIKLSNGWYEVIKEISQPGGKKTLIALILIKDEFPYQNKYLVNQFSEDFYLPAETILDTVVTNGSVIKTSQGIPLLSLQLPPGIATGNTGLSVFLLSLIGIICLYAFFEKQALQLVKKIGQNTAIIGLVVCVILLRSLVMRVGLPDFFYNLELFNPKIYGDASSVWLSSLGDLLINAILAVALAWHIRRNWNHQSITGRNVHPVFLTAATLILLYLISTLVNYISIGLVINSGISYNFNNLFNLSVYTYIALFIFGLCLFSFFLLTDTGLSQIEQFKLSPVSKILTYAIITFAFIISRHYAGSYDLIIILWPALLIVIIYFIRNKNKTYSFTSILLLVVVFTFYASYIFLTFPRVKENDNRLLFAERLAAEQDPMGEHLFLEMEDVIASDTALINMLIKDEETRERFPGIVAQKYFGGYWSKYDVKIYAFDTLCFPLIKVSNYNRDNLTYFENIIRKEGKETESPNLFYFDNPDGKINFLGRIHMYEDFEREYNIGTLYIELVSKYISEETGFPELLLDREIGFNNQLSNYSYAKYQNGNLVNYHGKFLYSVVSDGFPAQNDQPVFMDQEGYNHLIYKHNNKTIAVVSKKNEGLFGKITTFSYLFTFLTLLLLSLLLIRQYSLGLRFTNFSFKNRIQYLLVTIVLVSLVLFGGGTIFYIRAQYQEKNKEYINDKLFSALAELQQELGNETLLKNKNPEYLTYFLKKIANVLFTDVNLYSASGNLLASSRAKIFDQGLVSLKMNSEAYYQMVIHKKLQFTHDEKTGSLKYLSAYAPFKNDKGELLAYLNLPYFAGQGDLEKEISTFLAALINIYVLLFALSVLMAIFISGYVTQPLKVIQEKLRNIQLGKTNEPLEWVENDEIGNLVKEYNRMINELSKSAELLARSERESAWREMAKQVAHEIKNPLTPMKLSVQHLQRAWQDHSPDIDKKLEHITKTLIEQIDTLSHIASEFSSFAMMPKANNEKVCINNLIENVIHLFGEVGTELTFHSAVEEDVYVTADKGQLTRVFNNLLKNALQAIPNNRKGKVTIAITKQENNVLITIRDNGTGIDDAVIDKIFTPNFTTKTGGMGLGLAMVKNIIESFNGTIWFETQKNQGTTFFIRLPFY